MGLEKSLKMASEDTVMIENLSDIGKEEDVSPELPFTQAESPSKGEKGILIHSLESLFSTIKSRE